MVRKDCDIFYPRFKKNRGVGVPFDPMSLELLQICIAMFFAITNTQEVIYRKLAGMVDFISTNFSSEITLEERAK